MKGYSADLKSIYSVISDTPEKFEPQGTSTVFLYAIAERLEALVDVSQSMLDRFESIDIALGFQETQLKRIADALESSDELSGADIYKGAGVPGLKHPSSKED